MEFQIYLKILKYNGGEGGIEPTNELPRYGFQDVLSTAQPPLLEIKLSSLLLSKRLNNNK